jgi:altronate dehydratase
MQQDSRRTLLEEFMKDRHLSQVDLAKAAKISQSTVSRALARETTRQTKAMSRLFVYMQEQLRSQALSGIRAQPLSGKGKAKVINAFEAIWDGSDIHASAIANIITASRDLRPIKR